MQPGKGLIRRKRILSQIVKQPLNSIKVSSNGFSMCVEIVFLALSFGMLLTKVRWNFNGLFQRHTYLFQLEFGKS